MAKAMSITRRDFAKGVATVPLATIPGRASSAPRAELLDVARHHYGEFAKAMAGLSAGTEGWYLTGAGSSSGTAVMHAYTKHLVVMFDGFRSERQENVLTFKVR